MQAHEDKPSITDSVTSYPTSYNGGYRRPTESVDGTGTVWQYRMPDALASFIDRVTSEIAASDLPGAVALGFKIAIPACIAVAAAVLIIH